MSDSSFKNDSIVEIDASHSSISHIGFPYLSILFFNILFLINDFNLILIENLKSLKKIIFNQTKYLEDQALLLLGEYQLPNLKHLEIIQCPQITDIGVISLKNLKFVY